MNSVYYRLKLGIRYRDIPRASDYAARSTVYYWLQRWTVEGVWERLFQQLLGMLEREGKLDLSKGALAGSFVPAKRGVTKATTATRARNLDSGQRKG